MESGLGIAYTLLGLCAGFALGYLFARNRAVIEMADRVRKKIAEIKDDTIAETRKTVQQDLREELEVVIRDELEGRLAGPIKDDAEREAKKTIEAAEDKAHDIEKEAEREAEALIKDARSKAEAESKEVKKELQKFESKLDSRENQLERRQEKLETRVEDINSRASELQGKEEELSARETHLDDRENEVVKTLESAASLSAEEARSELIERMTGEAKAEAANKIREIEEEAEAEADKKAKKILSTTIQRWAGEYVADRTVSVVQLPSDDLKGRIIGREGRNIRALEAATGMDIIIDDTPEAVIVSGFNPVRRKVATLSLEKLISDGRIHPSRIEEVVTKTEEEVEAQIKEKGEQAAFELGIHGLHADVINLVGQLQYRTSYGQNMWSHSIEVGFLCGLMASELGVNVKMARRAGLLHDIGKALTHEREGSHALMGAEILERCGEHEIVRNAVAAHHNEEPQNSVIAHLVIAGDALSGARPGARREILGTYIKRLEDLERISSSFKGVEKSYAVQAGREIRVMVENSKVNDDDPTDR